MRGDIHISMRESVEGANGKIRFHVAHFSHASFRLKWMNDDDDE
jgi:hypothetical protein